MLEYSNTPWFTISEEQDIDNDNLYAYSYLMEESLKSTEKHLQVFPLDVEKFIKNNELKEITDPMLFARNNVPTENGLFSNEIFGITKEDRSTIFAYINLGGEEFLHPLAFKIWCKIDSNVKPCAAEVDTYRYDEQKGKLVPDPNGKNGFKFLKEVLKKVDFKRNKSVKREIKITFLEKYREKLFIKDFIVIPAGLRDVDTGESGHVGVGEINKLYNVLLRDTKALRETLDYGLNLAGSLRARIQDTIVKIYNWFIFGRDPLTGQDAQASGLSRKLGLIRRAGMKKSFDWGSRLVICTQDLRKESIQDIEVGCDDMGIPLAAICASMFPFMMFWIRRWFENNFSDVEYIMAVNPQTGKEVRTQIIDWREVYSDERIKKELSRFMHGMANRFIPIEAPIDEKLYKRKSEIPYLWFRGYMIPEEGIAEKIKNGEMDKKSYPLNMRPLTWCDLLYQAAEEVTRDKMCLITRFPVDSYWNQFPARIVLMSTIETEQIMINNTFYAHYPKISSEDIKKNSSNRFIDVAVPNNCRLSSYGADFDGDTISVKIPYSIEANEELKRATEKKSHFIGLGAKNEMKTEHEGLQSLYNLTMCLEQDEAQFTPSEQIQF